MYLFIIFVFYFLNRFLILIMNLYDYQISIFYFLRKNLIIEAIEFADKGERKFNDDILNFWKAYCYYRLKEKTQSLQILKDLEGKQEMEFLLKQLKDILHEKETQKNNILRIINQTDFILSNLCFLLFFEKKFKILKEIFRKLKINNYLVELAKVLLEMDDKLTLVNDQMTIDKIEKSLKKSLELKPNNPFGLLLSIEFEKKQKKISEMEILINKLENTTNLDNLIISLEKCEEKIISQRWDYLLSLTTNLLSSHPKNLLCLKYNLLYVLVFSGDSVKATEILDQIIILIEKHYWNNPVNQLLDIIKLLNCLVASNDNYIDICIKVLSKAKKVFKDNYDLILELAYSHLLKGNLDEAEDLYREAGKLDKTRFDPILFIVLLKLYKEELDEAEASLEFLKEIFSTFQEESSEFYFLWSVLSFLKAQKDIENKEDLYQQSSKFFDNALQIHIEKTKNLPNNIEFFKSFNPAFLLLLTKFFMINSDLSFTLKKMESGSIKNSDFIFKKCAKILSIILKKIPGLIAGYLLLVKAYLLNRNLSQATIYVQKVLDKDILNQEAHVYLLFISMMRDLKENTFSSKNVVETSTSANFELLENPEFLFLKSQVELREKNNNESLLSLEKARDLIENSEKYKNTNTLLKIEILTNLAILYAKSGDHSKSKELIQDIIMNYCDSNYNNLIILANCEINLLNNDVKTAIEILKNVEKDQESYEIAKIKLGDIYLVRLKQPRAYAKCYIDIVEKTRSQKNLEMLGDALFNIQEFEEAQNIYLDLEEEFGNNKYLCKKIGECFSKMHNFVRAKNYFENCLVKFEDNFEIKLEYSKLLKKIKDYSKIKKLFGLECLKFSDNLEKLEDFVNKKKFLEKTINIALLLFETYKNKYKLNKLESELKKVIYCIEKAIKAQKILLELNKNENFDINIEKKKLSNLYYKLIQIYFTTTLKNDSISDILEEYKKINFDDIKTKIRFAEINYYLGNLDISKENARNILKQEFQNEKAIKIFSDCLLSNLQFSGGIKGFHKMLEKEQKSKNTSKLLTRLIWFYRNNGKLNEFKKKLDVYKKTIFNKLDSTISLCYGLYYYFIRNFNEAIKFLNLVKNDDQYSNLVKIILIDIYIHSDSYLIYSNFFNKEKFKIFEKEYLDEIYELVNSLHQEEQSQQKILYLIIYEYLEDPLKIDHCISKFELLKKNIFYKPFLSIINYYLAIWFTRTKKKGNLKEILMEIKNSKYYPINNYDEYFFKGLLLCSDILLNKDKIKPSKILIDKALKVNENCLLAYEYLYVLKEKNKEDILTVLEKAYEMTNFQDPNLGYKLSKQLFKEEKYIESFKICKNVLTIYPKFGKIEKDVLIPVKEYLLYNY